jgi:hypothetical protein
MIGQAHGIIASAKEHFQYLVTRFWHWYSSKTLASILVAVAELMDLRPWIWNLG